MSIEEQASQALIEDSNYGQNYNTTPSPVREHQTVDEESRTTILTRRVDVVMSLSQEYGLIRTMEGKRTAVGTRDPFPNANSAR